ncbi:MAG: mycofactocin system FadH/OYE family oxidoreductase 1 [Acidimicrobiales bacterium]
MTSLSDPVRLGRREARTRLVFGPHETNLAAGRAFSKRHVAYYRARAAGGAGVIVVEESSVDESDRPYERAPLASLASEGWSAISSACHDEGALVIAALGHAGGEGSSAYHQRVLLGASPVPGAATGEVPKAMEAEEIEALIAAFAAAAGAAVGAGCDGVELNAGQYSLLRQFCSQLTNLRHDELGTDRGELLRRVISSTREAVARTSPDGLVGLRLSVDELTAGAGIVPETAVSLVAALAPSGIDYLCAVRGSGLQPAATRPDSHVEQGFNRRSAAIVRSGLPCGVALVAQGSVVDVALAEELVAGGEADLVEMTRAQIADPGLGGKVAAGAADRVRPCVLCNQTCRVRDVTNPVVTCIGEPRSGHETTDPAADPPFGPGFAVKAAERRTHVLIVGGGPAGLECARVLCLGGVEVTLVERDHTLGGMVRVAARAPGRERLAALVDWLESECRRGGVRIVTDHEATLEEVDGHEGPVVHCTGSRPGRRSFEVAPGAAIATAAEVLSAERQVAEPPPSPVVVFDPVGGPIGVGVAELLATHGAAVSLVTPDHVVGSRLVRSGDIAPANVRLGQRGVELVRRSDIVRVDGKGVTVEHLYSGERRLIEAALCVDAGFLLPQDALWRAAGGWQPRAGDAVAPRTVHEAVLEGRRVALEIVGGNNGTGSGRASR